MIADAGIAANRKLWLPKIRRKTVETATEFWYYQTSGVEERFKNAVNGKRRLYLKEA
jgi:hypothetical protein